MIAKPNALSWSNAGYSTKRHGITITNCDAEPVQTPGCVQAHGALLVLRRSDLSIVQASENADEILGAAASALLRQPISAVLGADGAAELQKFLIVEQTERNPLYLRSITTAHDATPLDVTVHSINGVVILEFEPTTRTTNVGVVRESEYYSLVRKTIARIEKATTLKEFCDTAASEVRALTGFDRVMVYKFHADFHGEVVAESKRDDLGSWLGLHYPADDIPVPARHIFSKVWVRPVPDINGELAELVPLLNSDSGDALEMTYCALRGPSKMYTEYLQNMGVTACLTMPVRSGEKLWGLIACHHYAGVRAVPHQLRSACELLAQVLSLHHSAVQAREHLQYQMAIGEAHQTLVTRMIQEGLATTASASTPSLLDGINADGTAIYYHGQWWMSGTTPDEPTLEALSDWLLARPEFQLVASPLFATDALGLLHPPALDLTTVACGLMAVPLSIRRRELLMWFRTETIHTVNWAGDPSNKPTVTGTHGPRLTPRRSFELFRESVRLRSLPWLEVEQEAVVRLRTLVLEVAVSRAEELMAINTELARANEELDAFAYVASHDLKEPLRGIHQYAGQLVDDAEELALPQRHKVDGVLRLTLRMDRLLDALMQYARAGRGALDFEMTDLNAVVSHAQEMLIARLSQHSGQVLIPRPLPMVLCDASSVGEIFTNLLSNALKYTNQPTPQVEVGYVAPDESVHRTTFPPEARDQTVYFVRDEGIGIKADQFDLVFKMFKRMHGREEYGGGTGAGLSIVKKMVERHRGVVWIESAPNAGTTFYFSLSSSHA